MPQDWRDREPPERRDFGQADYSVDYGYDPRNRTGYRIEADPRLTDEEREYARRMNSGVYSRDAQPRSWSERAGAFFSGEREPAPRRRGPSDRVLWAVIVERMDHERRLDLRDVEVIVEDAEVTLNGTVAHKNDKRRIEDVADIDGVRHVQNNLRVRHHGFFR